MKLSSALLMNRGSSAAAENAKFTEMKSRRSLFMVFVNE